MAFFRHDGASSIEYVDAIPVHHKTNKQKRLWRFIGMGVAAVVIIVIVIVVAVVVTNNKKNSSTNSYSVSPYSQIKTIVTHNDTALQQKERIFVVGDIHGCVNELNTLVNKLNFNQTTDQLILAGDLTSKGPDSIGVIRRAKELGALCVRGNHDDKVVRFKTFQLQNGENAMKPPQATMPEGDVPDPLKFKNYHVPIALNMTQEDYDYLYNCPAILHLPFLNNTVIVHGGIDPTIPSLENQVPYWVMNMRDIDNNNQPNIEKGTGTQWATVWNADQKKLTVNNTLIFYGHDSSRGLNIQQSTFGLDSGCVYGNQLTAMNARTKELTQIDCPTYAKKGGDSDD
ncbi:Metallo-dependent phosphatase-like protein [Gilbertella persicaria]|uniref:Metallo-dependent phosphatase-like protein n=1 Tax=Gilbertella persicaria TaxID=101096 RepID=UPI00221EE3D2|nr:Metallo-dependent phosphatase-like protein [Gilbertella persicaria]KAI8086988.1 Metallo-dependent phosphatase-like protein [Gilbertella persicaria]